MGINALGRLNESQQSAAECCVESIAQVIAGPGTGKTHTLIARIIYLLNRYKPCEIVVVTFTRKAIQEIKDRLRTLVGNKQVDNMYIGTFHSICLGLLQKSTSVPGFIVWDDRDITLAVKQAVDIVRHERLNDKDIDFKSAKSTISQWKNHDQNHDGLKNDDPMVQVFKAYEHARIQSGAFDFDDLLIQGRDLIISNPNTISSMKCMLVDEFQDSNKVQVDIVEAFCKQSHSVWMVGDPDQAIYGFRGSAPRTFQDICNRVENIHLYHLTNNYRSTPEILKIAHQVMTCHAQASSNKVTTTRQQLKSSIPATNLSPTLTTEDRSIGLEIQRLVNQSCGILNYGDCAILSRTSYELTRLEYILVTMNIPYISLSSKAQFWNRIEHALIIDYMRVIDNQRDQLAVSRTINTPSRLIGPARIKSAQKLSPYIFNGLKLLSKEPSTPKSTKNAIEEYINIITEGIALLAQEKITPLTALFDFLFKRLELEKYLTDLDKKGGATKCDNEEQISSKVTSAMALRNVFAHYQDNYLPNQGGGVSMVRDFLQTLCVDQEDAGSCKDDQKTIEKLTLSTMHGAKGLEWPVVYVINLHKTQMPFFRAVQEKEIQEELRLLYVAMTRAKYLLNLSYDGTLGLSDFLQPIQQLSQQGKVNFENKDWIKLAHIMGRKCPEMDDLNAARCIFQQTNRQRFASSRQGQEEKENIPVKRIKLGTQEPAFQGGFIRASQLARVMKEKK